MPARLPRPSSVGPTAVYLDARIRLSDSPALFRVARPRELQECRPVELSSQESAPTGQSDLAREVLSPIDGRWSPPLKARVAREGKEGQGAALSISWTTGRQSEGNISLGGEVGGEGG